MAGSVKSFFTRNARQQIFFFCLFRTLFATASAIKQSYNIRLATRDDIPLIRNCNLENLPENYSDNFYQNQLTNWPELSLVCEYLNDKTALAGYALGRVESSKNNEVTRFMMPTTPAAIYLGHVSSLAVSPQHRKKMVALSLMKKLHEQFVKAYDVNEVSLYCRVS